MLQFGLFVLFWYIGFIWLLVINMRRGGCDDLMPVMPCRFGGEVVDSRGDFDTPGF